MPNPPHRILYFVPNDGVYDITVPHRLDVHQQLVGGLIEPMHLFEDRLGRAESLLRNAWLELVANEEGIGDNLPSGWVWPLGSGMPGVPIFGSFFVALAVPDPTDGIIWTDLTDPDVKMLLHAFAVTPDMIHLHMPQVLSAPA